MIRKFALVKVHDIPFAVVKEISSVSKVIMAIIIIWLIRNCVYLCSVLQRDISPG